jgi:YXWGXW repeat-containing protein
MKRIHRLVAAAGLAAAIAGCAAGVAYEDSYGYATVAPPAYVQVDVQGVAPYPDAIWIDGYWNWSGNRWLWRRGYWGHARAGYSWVPHRWYRDGRGWRMSAGHWVRRR